VLTTAEPLRSADPEALAPLAWAAGIETVETAPNPSAALARARALLRPGELLVIAGSFLLAGALRRELVAR
jgi:folylpolyglutamate synthase/dihydropteroate synthase